MNRRHRQTSLEDEIFTGGERETPLRLKRAREDNESDQLPLMEVRKRLAVVAAQTEWVEVDKEKAVVEKKNAILPRAKLGAMTASLV